LRLSRGGTYLESSFHFLLDSACPCRQYHHAEHRHPIPKPRYPGFHERGPIMTRVTLSAVGAACTLWFTRPNTPIQTWRAEPRPLRRQSGLHSARAIGTALTNGLGVWPRCGNRRLSAPSSDCVGLEPRRNRPLPLTCRRKRWRCRRCRRVGSGRCIFCGQHGLKLGEPANGWFEKHAHPSCRSWRKKNCMSALTAPHGEVVASRGDP